MMCMRCPGTKTIPQVEFQQRQQSKKYVGLNATARARKQLRFEDSCLSISHHKDVRVAIAVPLHASFYRREMYTCTGFSWMMNAEVYSFWGNVLTLSPPRSNA